MTEVCGQDVTPLQFHIANKKNNYTYIINSFHN